jgi:uncharacterized OB-fold protein
MKRPLPEPDEVSAPFFDGLSRGVVMVQACHACGQQQLGQDRCFACRSEDLGQAEATGRGVVHSFAVMHAVFHPAFANEVPYVVALVELDEGPRILGRMRAIPHSGMKVGLRVEVSSIELADGVFAPVFEPAQEY